MTKPKAVGFAGEPKPKQKTPNKHQAASGKYDEMKSKGLPEFSIFVRIKGKEWVPAGSMAVERSNQISRAIFQQEKELRQGVFRLYPKLRKFENELEYGYRLKEFVDEEITLALPPQPSFGDQVKQKIQGLFKKS